VIVVPGSIEILSCEKYLRFNELVDSDATPTSMYVPTP